MGNDNSKITYSAQEQGRQKAQEDNERELKEMLEKLEIERQQASRDAEASAKSEDEKERKKLQKQRHEKEEIEKRQKDGEGLLQLRHQLLNYDFHKCPRSKKETFQDLEVDDIDLIRIALLGPAGSGKSALVGTIQRAIGEPQSAFEQGTGKEGTIHLEEYYIQKKIRMVDTRGFFERDERLMDECLDIITGRTRLGEEIIRDYDSDEWRYDEKQKPNTGLARKPPSLSKYAHAVIFVLKANDPRLEQDIYKETLQKIRGYFRENGYYPVTVITYLDMLKTKEDKEKVFDKAREATGGPGGRTDFITNYTHENNEWSFEVDRTALEILDYALISAENFIRIRKQREKNRLEREAPSEGAIGGVDTVAEFFARLVTKYHLTDQGNTKAVLAELRKKEINTIESLKDLWEDVKADLPLSIGMQKIMDQEIKNI